MNADLAPFDLRGQVAVVTGASSGLGRHFALTLARTGAKVAIAARRSERLAELAQEIAGFDARALPITLDVADASSVRACVEAAETELGPISILVNNAGVAIDKPTVECSEDDWDRVLDTNLKGAWLMARETARHMIGLEHGGSIINIASVLGLAGAARVAAYCASKAGLINLTRALAVELARHDIRVNAIAPGYVETDLNRAFLASTAGRALQGRIPQRRFGRPEDLDGALLLLASSASRYMTGATLVIDGGLSAQV
ncbi:MAG: glucose 1-dehydrogenase [Alphaproteobacteria bacterium]|nr:MAG: glucose 1-dehydrogenase [Alphaproteobacteria bacterium]